MAGITYILKKCFKKFVSEINHFYSYLCHLLAFSEQGERLHSISSDFEGSLHFYFNK